MIRAARALARKPLPRTLPPTDPARIRHTCGPPPFPVVRNSGRFRWSDSWSGRREANPRRQLQVCPGAPVPRPDLRAAGHGRREPRPVLGDPPVAATSEWSPSSSSASTRSAPTSSSRCRSTARTRPPRCSGSAVPEFEGSRRPWTSDQLRARSRNSEAMRQILLRLADPREYLGADLDPSGRADGSGAAQVPGGATATAVRPRRVS